MVDSSGMNRAIWGTSCAWSSCDPPHEHETRGPVRVIGGEHTDVQTRDGGPD